MNKEIKILHIDSERGWRGGQQQAVYLFERLLQKGYKTSFICRSNTKLSEYLKEKQLPFYEVSMKNELDLFSAYKIAKIAKKENYNVLHLHSAHAHSIGLLAKLFYKSIKLVSVRRVDFSVNKNILSKLKYNNQLIDKIVCISHAIKDVMISDGIDEKKLLTIHSGININKFDDINTDVGLKKILGIHENEIIVGTVAAMVKHKDYPNLLHAAEIVLREFANVTFIAVGDGKNKEYLLKLADNLKISKKVKFLGYRTDVGELLKIFDIFVLSSKKEGLGTSVLDAQAVGLPVVCTRAGGIPEMIIHGENGYLAPPQNPEALANEIIKLLHDEEKRKNFGLKAKETVRDFDINKTVENNIKLYEELI